MCCGVVMCAGGRVILLLFLVAVFSSWVDSTFTCPKDCFCAPHSKNVQCANKNFRTIPEGIHWETLELNLNENKFKNSGLTRRNLTEFHDLQNLYLSECGIERIAVGTFSDLLQLTWLDISKNNIRFLADFTFSGLHFKHLFLNDNLGLQLSLATFTGMTTQGLYMNDCGLTQMSVDLMTPLNGSLKTLWLHGNNVELFTEKWLYFLRRLAHVRLGGNPFHCNCQLVWLYNLHKTSKMSLFAGTEQLECGGPYLVKGTKFEDMTSEDFHCQLPTFQNVDAVFDNKMGKLTCQARGDPAPTVYWIRPDGSTETFHLKPDHEGDQNQGLIFLVDSKFENKEVYKCVAANQAGNVTFSLNVVWPGTRLNQQQQTNRPTPKTTKFSKNIINNNKTSTSSSSLIREETTSLSYKTFDRNYANDDSQIYNWNSQSDRRNMRLVDKRIDIDETATSDKLFTAVDVIGAVVGTFLLTLLATVTIFHFCYRNKETFRTEEQCSVSDKSSTIQCLHDVYIRSEIDDNCIKVINNCQRNYTETTSS